MPAHCRRASFSAQSLPRRFLGAFLVALVGSVGVALVIWGALGLLGDAEDSASFRDLAAATAAHPADEDQAGLVFGRDWDALLAAQPETCAWLQVAGTTVDVPMMRSTADDPERWLYRGLDGTYSDVGTPYLDHRCEPDGDVMVVYGHRTLYESYIFHDLSAACEQAAFDGVSTASWETPSHGIVGFKPLCAASVDMSDAQWQRFSFATTGEMRDWLSWCVDAASARSADAETLAADAGRCLVLVTCNGRAYHPSTRTVAIFVSEGGG